MASWPALVKTFSNRTDLVDTINAVDVNAAYDEITAMQGSLGLGLLTSTWTGAFTQVTTSATLKARLDNIERGVIGDVHNQYVKKGGDTITGDLLITEDLRTDGSIVAEGDITSYGAFTSLNDGRIIMGSTVLTVGANGYVTLTPGLTNPRALVVMNGDDAANSGVSLIFSKVSTFADSVIMRVRRADTLALAAQGSNIRVDWVCRGDS
jgi:hypothetical protein